MKNADGRFRLCHYAGLVAIVFLLGLWVVWLQVSITRLGYAANEARALQEELSAERDRLFVDVEQRRTALAIELLSAGGGRR